MIAERSITARRFFGAVAIVVVSGGLFTPYTSRNPFPSLRPCRFSKLPRPSAPAFPRL